MSADEDLKLSDLLKYYLRESQAAKVTILFFKKWTALQKAIIWGFPGGAVVESLPAIAGDTGSSPGLGRSHMPRSN